MTKPLDLKLEVTVRSYLVKLPVKDFIALEKAEDNLSSELGQDMLNERLERDTQAQNVEYNGHFGAQIMFELAVDDDNETEHDKIKNLINDQVLKARAYHAGKKFETAGATPSP